MKSRLVTNIYFLLAFVPCLMLGSSALAGHSLGNGLRVLEEVESGLVGLAEHTLPSVVSISPFVPESSVGTPESLRKRPNNAGAGVIVDGRNGYLITNAHVVRKAEKIRVTLYGGQEYVGNVLGTDEETDLAVVHINSDEILPQVSLGDSSKLKIGQLVVAIGNPYGLKETLSLGVISGLNRENINLSRYEDFIQTDASINPGNSGGPLLNIRGEVIGINTAIINYAQSIGFAIPSNVVKNVSRQIIEHGEVNRGWLGVGIENVPEDVAAQVNLAKGRGVMINSIFEGQPAHMAGLKVGDIILKIGGSNVDSPNGMIRLIGNVSPGQFINLDILRDGEERTYSIQLGHRKDQMEMASLQQNPLPELGFDWTEHEAGATTGDHEDSDKKKEGVLVTRVEPGGSADRGGLMVGDLITALNGQDVINRGHFESILRQNHVRGSISVTVQRADEEVSLTLSRSE
ncbi:Serine protease Do [Nitrospina gracilis 3/211]|uniref:Serine protease Do n=2 Tax=Nitrospinaceae TaxID=407032 RepID=M1ZD44_NITG3|nr:Serine protease Do [Nitrospina gracilis 3/211]